MLYALPEKWPLVRVATLVWRKRTGQVYHEVNFETEVNDMITSTANAFWEQTLQHGELNGAVRVSSKRGQSLQVFDGKWCSSDSQVDVLVPCGHTPEAYEAAYGLASELTTLFLDEERRVAEEKLRQAFDR